MKKVIRLTERDLNRLVKRVISEGVVQYISASELNQKLKSMGAVYGKPANVQMYEGGTLGPFVKLPGETLYYSITNDDVNSRPQSGYTNS
jgi:hypothetical protein